MAAFVGQAMVPTGAHAALRGARSSAGATRASCRRRGVAVVCSAEPEGAPLASAIRAVPTHPDMPRDASPTNRAAGNAAICHASLRAVATTRVDRAPRALCAMNMFTLSVPGRSPANAPWGVSTVYFSLRTDPDFAFLQLPRTWS